MSEEKRLESSDRPAEEPKCERCGGTGWYEDDLNGYPCFHRPPTTEPASEGKADTLRTITPKRFDGYGQEIGKGVGTKDIYPTAPPASIEDRAKELEEAVRQLTWDAELSEALGETDPHAKQFAANLRTVLAEIDRQKPDIERAAVDRFAQECRSVTTDLVIQDGIIEEATADLKAENERLARVIKVLKRDCRNWLKAQEDRGLVVSLLWVRDRSDRDNDF